MKRKGVKYSEVCRTKYYETLTIGMLGEEQIETLAIVFQTSFEMDLCQITEE